MESVFKETNTEILMTETGFVIQQKNRLEGGGTDLQSIDFPFDFAIKMVLALNENKVIKQAIQERNDNKFVAPIVKAVLKELEQRELQKKRLGS